MNTRKQVVPIMNSGIKIPSITSIPQGVMKVSVPQTPQVRQVPIVVPQVRQVQIVVPPVVPSIPKIPQMRQVPIPVTLPEVQEVIPEIIPEVIPETIPEVQELIINTSPKIIKTKEDEMMERIKGLEERQIEIMDMLRWIVERKRRKEMRQMEIQIPIQQMEIVPQMEIQIPIQQMKIPTMGMTRITKEEIRKMTLDEIEKGINRLAKNVSTYKKKYINQEPVIPGKMEEIEVMAENLKLMREVRGEKKDTKK